MSTRTVSIIGWAVCIFSFALTALSLLLLTLNVLEPGVHIFEHWIENTALAIGFSAVGAVVVSRCHPPNPMGWMFCVVGFLFAAVHFVAEYAIYALLAEPGSLPAGEAAAWIYSWLFAPQLGLGALLVLLFPNGRLPSARWRWFVWFSVLATSVATAMAALSPGRSASVWDRSKTRSVSEACRTSTSRLRGSCCLSFWSQEAPKFCAYAELEEWSASRSSGLLMPQRRRLAVASSGTLYPWR